ncbi:hypothetical protein C9J60_08390 [Streptomyces sp. A244]|nr:hypothetical protein C9J60_08390 [Streptomyces sp. A244]
MNTVEWRTFSQRLILLVLLGGLVVGLIAYGLDPYAALLVASGILYLLKDAWLPETGGASGAAGKVFGKARGGRALPPGDGGAGGQNGAPPSGEPEPAPGDESSGDEQQ